MKRVKWIALFLTVVFLFSIGVSGCAPKAQTASEDVIKIGFVGPLTGDVKTFGTSTQNGFLLALKEHDNTAGGLKIEYVIGDDANTPNQATAVATKLITQDKVSAIVGSVTSKCTIPLAVVAEQYKVPLVSPTATSPKVTMDPTRREYAFRACFIDPFQGTVGANFAYNTLNARTAAVLFDQGNDYTVGLKDFFAEAFTKLGGKVLVSEAYSVNDTDFSAQLTKIAGLNPDVIFLPDYYQKVSLIGKQARDRGIKAAFLGGDGWDSSEIDWATMDGGYFSNHYASDDPDPLVQKWSEAYQAAYGSKPDALATLAYDATNILLNAINTAKSSDPAKIKDAIQATKDLQLVSGKISINEEGNPVKAAVILKIDGASKTSKFVTRVNP
jgi:branched-chain amino acid transport system substrate-binding protein